MLELSIKFQKPHFPLVTKISIQYPKKSRCTHHSNTRWSFASYIPNLHLSKIQSNSISDSFVERKQLRKAAKATLIQNCEEGAKIIGASSLFYIQYVQKISLWTTTLEQNFNSTFKSQSNSEKVMFRSKDQPFLFLKFSILPAHLQSTFDLEYEHKSQFPKIA